MALDQETTRQIHLLKFRMPLLFVLRNGNFQSTADQAFEKNGNFTAWFPTHIIARQKTGGASVACAGGVYDAAAKGGNAVVAAVQSWVTLAATVPIVATLAAVATGTVMTSTSLYLSLTTGSTAACTGDVFVFGYALD